MTLPIEAEIANAVLAELEARCVRERNRVNDDTARLKNERRRNGEAPMAKVWHERALLFRKLQQLP